PSSSLSLHSSPHPPHLPSFPTRRSSDLAVPRRASRLSRDPVPRASPPPRSGARQDREPRGRLRAGVRQGCALSPGRMSAMKITRSEEHTSELQSLRHLVCRLLLEKKK